MRTLIALLTLALVPACPRSAVGPETAPEIVTLRGQTMGTSYQVKVLVRSAAESARAVALQPALDSLLERVNDQMSTYRPESELSRFNRAEAHTPFAVSAATAEVAARALALGEATLGAFDVTLGPLIELWGFDKGGPRKEPPGDSELRAARARVGRERLRVQGNTLVKDRPDVLVNLSGIAKGWGVDQVFEQILAAGFVDVMVEIGGEVRAAGRNARGEPWRIGVNVPRSDADPTAVLVAVPLQEAALATSGDYRNFFESNGRRYSHILDPGTGAPVRRDLISVSVLAPDCTTADGLATAALVLGEARTRAVLEQRFPGVEALFVHAPEGPGGELKVTRTAGFPAAPVP